MMGTAVFDQSEERSVLLDDAFYDVTLEHVDQALEAEQQHGFPEDSFGLLRIFLRTLGLIAADRATATNSTPVDRGALEAAIVDRLEVLVQFEKSRLSQLEQGPSSVGGIGHTLN